MSFKCGHIRWAFDFAAWRPTINELQIAVACIQPEEKQRLAKFVFRDDFDASLIGRLLLRKFVHTTTNLPYDKIEFGRDDRGKPYLLERRPDLDFNVSHQGDFAVLAGIYNQSTDDTNKQEMPPKIGVDVMKIEYTGGKPLNHFFRLMDRNFSSIEWQNIRSKATEREQLQAFMRHWCLKESYVKNIGIGITIDLRKISFGIASEYEQQQQQQQCDTIITDTTLTVDNVPQTGWTFEESQLNNDHCVAVAMYGTLPHNYRPPSFQLLTFNELTRGCIPLMAIDHDYCTAILNKPYKERNCSSSSS